MDDSEIEDLVDKAFTVFEQEPIELETGLGVDDATTLQLRKACRLLTAANFLQSTNGYYTVVIEASFVAIERTIQFYLLETDFITPDDYIDHVSVYHRGADAGLYSTDFGDKLVELWQNNRSDTYYREGRGSATRAETMYTLATRIHDHVLQLAGETHTCICHTT